MTAPEVWSPACAPGGMVCGAVQHPAEAPSGLIHNGRWICGMPVEDEPCPDHGEDER